MNFPVVKIVWDDASTLEHGWVDPVDEKPKPQLATTIGFLVAETEDHIVIASTTDGTWVNGRFQIPKAMIKSQKPLQRQRKPKKAEQCQPNP